MCLQKFTLIQHEMSQRGCSTRSSRLGLCLRISQVLSKLSYSYYSPYLTTFYVLRRVKIRKGNWIVRHRLTPIRAPKPKQSAKFPLGQDCKRQFQSLNFKVALSPMTMLPKLCFCLHSSLWNGDQFVPANPVEK